jgi:hypothetical protein
MLSGTIFFWMGTLSIAQFLKEKQRFGSGFCLRFQAKKHLT